jgi:cytoskeletal protein CcmA (bactofilin family)
MLILGVFILLILLFLLPFLPGVAELVRKEDCDPLFIPMDYTKDPRYFGKSFKHLIQQATEVLSADQEIHEVLLSKKEKLEIVELVSIPDGAEIDHLLYVKGNFSSGGHVRLTKEAYVMGDATVGPNNFNHALAADGNVKVNAGTQFLRWLDANGAIEILENCSLGISVSSGSKLCLARNCLFRRLYGMPIVTGNTARARVTALKRSFPPAESLPPELSFVRKKERFIEPGTIITHNTVFPQDVRIGSGCIFKGDIKSYGELVLEANVIIDGSVFADREIIIGRNANISGHIFSQKAVYICERTVISCPTTLKTIIGKKSVSIEQNVTIYGYVLTEGDGKIL